MSNKPKVSIVDYGVGNLKSLLRAFGNFKCDVYVVDKSQDIMGSDAIILPGDGAFKAGMTGLEKRKLSSAVLSFAQSNKPILGICLGAQILLSEGFEFGHYKGLNLIEGKVTKFPKSLKGEKIPQIGWNEIIQPLGQSWKKSILKDMKTGDCVYFIHSYVMEPKNKKEVLAITNYGGVSFASVIGKGNIYGCQFHPEKSAKAGLGIIKNFVGLLH